MNVKHLGQVFTPVHIVEKMLKLKKNNGRTLEPSAGDGAFSSKIDNCISIEIDKDKATKSALNIDFFDYSITEKFDTIIGNPPYVKYKDIINSTKDKLDMELFNERTNLSLFFIYKSIQHLKDNGELIFIVPRDFLKATSSQKLNEYIYETGTITDFYDLGDKVIFKDAVPNTVIFRYEKNNFNRKTSNNKIFKCINGQLLFLENEYNIKFSDLFFVKVGAVSGADKLFENEKGNLKLVCSETKTTGKTKKMFYNIEAPELLKHKDVLINRKIKKFTEKDWYMWGRKYYESKAMRIYVNNKTRQLKPFFYNSCKAYDGSVLAIFPKFKCNKKKILELIDDLNNVDWDELGFVCDGRYLFTQKSLENTMLPKTFEKHLKTKE